MTFLHAIHRSDGGTRIRSTELAKDRWCRFRQGFGAICSVAANILQNLCMANTFLTVPFRDKDAAKALGARWDAAQRQWFVPEGRELAPFALWLPAGPSAASSTQGALAMLDGSAAPLAPAMVAVAGKKGISLSSLLGGVSRAVAQAYQAGVWTLVEVVELRAHGGHVYLEVSERDAHGTVLAKARATIWKSTASAILPAFEQATGAQLAPGIKLLVRARPVFKAQHGFSLDIDAIDPEYTLGELEARKREIRARLQAEGVFEANKRLAPPWDFNAVLVLAPTGGAGLGDFQAEADRLQAHGICRFIYALTRFQGEEAPAQIRAALQAALQARAGTGTPAFDAVVIIRGGGATNDLAWLNDYALARFICELSIPVLTGIGHERDSTLLDEVAHQRYDTPSKVVAGIEQRIVQRVGEARASFEQVCALAGRASQGAREQSGQLEMEVRLQAQGHVARGRQAASECMAAVRMDAMQGVRRAAEQSQGALQAVKVQAAAQLASVQREVPALWSQVAASCAHAVQAAGAESRALLGGVLHQAQFDAQHARQVSREALDNVSTSARGALRKAQEASQALVREITGQGPQKTLQRGFAIVRTQSGQPVTRAAQAPNGQMLEIEFQDGRVTAITQQHL